MKLSAIYMICLQIWAKLSSNVGSRWNYRFQHFGGSAGWVKVWWNVKCCNCCCSELQRDILANNQQYNNRFNYAVGFYIYLFIYIFLCLCPVCVCVFVCCFCCVSILYFMFVYVLVFVCFFLSVSVSVLTSQNIWETK